MIKGFKQMLFFQSVILKKNLKGLLIWEKIIFGCVFMEDFSPLNSVAHDCHGWFCCLLKEMGTRAEICEGKTKGPKADASMRVMQNFNSVI